MIVDAEARPTSAALPGDYSAIVQGQWGGTRVPLRVRAGYIYCVDVSDTEPAGDGSEPCATCQQATVHEARRLSPGSQELVARRSIEARYNEPVH